MDKKRIFIIDDEASFTRMVRLNLEKTNEFEVREENRAGSAVAAAREFKPDLILLDVIMPTMDGGDIAANIRKDRKLKKVPIIFLTATVSHREAGAGGLTSGGSLFLAKPVSVEVLVERIKEHLPPEEVEVEAEESKQAEPAPKDDEASQAQSKAKLKSESPTSPPADSAAKS
jgi:DNA-binding response OmpR family regulator